MQILASCADPIKNFAGELTIEALLHKERSSEWLHACVCLLLL